MKNMLKQLLVFTLAVTLTGLPVLATTTQSNIASVNLTATVSSTLTVAVNTTSLTFDNANTTSPVVNVTTTWNFGTQFSALDTVAYFDTAQALTSGSNVIPTSAVNGIAAGGSGPCSQSQNLGGIPFIAACADIFNVNSTAGLSGINTSPFQLAIPTLASFPPGVYTGVVHITALAF